MACKQVLLIRKDLKMRRGKEIAQGSHASMAFLVSRLRTATVRSGKAEIVLSSTQQQWIDAGMAKVCLQVQSEQQLLDCHQQALAVGLESHLIRDSGKTEFGGTPTYTACAIGPDLSSRIDAITGHLKLY